METLKFFDFKEKKSFLTNDYKIEMKGNRKFAVAIAPSGTKSYRAVKK